MLFLILSNANIDFLGWKLRWRTYTTKKVLSTIRYIELGDKKKFAAIMLNPEYEIYIVHVESVNSNVLPSSSLLNVHTSRKPQIAGLIAKEAPTKVPAKYLDFADVFLPNLAFKLPDHTRINEHAIKLIDSQQPSYRSIYNLELVELETLKAYIETNLANEFIRLSKSPANTSILVD